MILLYEIWPTQANKQIEIFLVEAYPRHDSSSVEKRNPILYRDEERVAEGTGLGEEERAPRGE